jgi:hypothetical protein
MKLVYSIPVDCFYDIVMSWIELDDLGRLDSAVDKLNKNWFTQAISHANHKLCIKLHPKHHHILLLEWLSKRDLRCVNLTLTDHFLSKISHVALVLGENAVQLTKCLKEVSTIKYSIQGEKLPNNKELLALLVSLCPLVSSLDVKSQCNKLYYSPRCDSIFVHAEVSLVYENWNSLHTLCMRQTLLETTDAVAVLNALPALCNIEIKNSPCIMMECHVCLLFASAFHSVTRLVVEDFFGICGQRRRVDTSYSVEGVAALFESTSCEELLSDKWYHGPDVKFKCKHLFECFEPVSKYLVYLTVDNHLSHFAKRYMDSGGCKNLTVLKGLYNVGDAFVKSIAVNCKSLCKLALYQADTVTEVTLIELCVALPGLTHLTLYGMHMIGDAALTDGLAKLHNLEYLRLSLYKVTQKPLAVVIAGNLNLRCVILLCVHASPGWGDSIRTALRSLKKLVKCVWE